MKRRQTSITFKLESESQIVSHLIHSFRLNIKYWPREYDNIYSCMLYVYDFSPSLYLFQSIVLDFYTLVICLVSSTQNTHHNKGQFSF